MSTTPHTRAPRRLGDLPRRWLEILVGTVFWCLLWGAAGPGEIISGVLASSAVALVFPLPLVSPELTIRPLACVSLAAHFALDMTRSAVEVAWYAVRPAGPPPSSVVAVRLRSRSDLFLTVTAMLVTLIPGSVVVEAQRSTGTLFLHVIGADDESAVEAARCSALRQEERVLRALARASVLDDALGESTAARGEGRR